MTALADYLRGFKLGVCDAADGVVRPFRGDIERGYQAGQSTYARELVKAEERFDPAPEIHELVSEGVRRKYEPECSCRSCKRTRRKEPSHWKLWIQKQSATAVLTNRDGTFVNHLFWDRPIHWAQGVGDKGTPAAIALARADGEASGLTEWSERESDLCAGAPQSGGER